MLLAVMPNFSVIEGPAYLFKPLTADRVDQAYPLVTGSAPSIEQWRRYALHLIEAREDENQRCGIHVAEAPERYLRGLFSYLVGPDLRRGECLRVDCIALPDSLDRSMVADALISRLGALADEHACQAVLIHLDEHHQWLNGKLTGAGYEAGSSYFVGTRGAAPSV